MMRRWRESSMKCRRPVFFGSLVVSTGASSPFLPIRTSSKKQTRATFAANQGSAGKLGQPDRRCAMLPRCRRRGSTYRNRPRQAQIEGTGQRGVRGCRGAAAVALGCFSSGPNARAAFGYWNQNFRYLPYKQKQARNRRQSTQHHPTRCEKTSLWLNVSESLSNSAAVKTKNQPNRCEGTKVMVV